MQIPLLILAFILAFSVGYLNRPVEKELRLVSKVKESPKVRNELEKSIKSVLENDQKKEKIDTVKAGAVDLKEQILTALTQDPTKAQSDEIMQAILKNPSLYVAQLQEMIMDNKYETSDKEAFIVGLMEIKGFTDQKLDLLSNYLLENPSSTDDSNLAAVESLALLAEENPDQQEVIFELIERLDNDELTNEFHESLEASISEGEFNE